jgi:AmmeMemoRadiSam system protein B
VAGLFYPSDRRELEQSVRGYLGTADRGEHEAPPKALIAPHAGYVYSGPIAASAYARLEPVAERIERVVLLGPAHRVFLRGLAAPRSAVFTTPLGDVPVDREAIELVLPLPQVRLDDAPHAPEHSLEVHLPFLQLVLGDFSLVPLAVGDASAEEVAEVLELLWGGPETLIVISSDLSHYYDYATARRLDAETTRAIEALRPEDLGAESACGRVAIGGLLVAARRHGLRAHTVDVRSSGDTAGPRDEVVGYGAYVFA